MFQCFNVSNVLENGRTATTRESVADSVSECAGGVAGGGDCDQRILVTRSFGTPLSPSVPVRVRYRGGPWINTYAALDSWATSGFISRELFDRLGADGHVAEFKLSTMSGEDKAVSAAEVLGLEVSGLGPGKDKIYSLEPVLKGQNWPFSAMDVPTEDLVADYTHLRSIPWHFMRENIGLLLGANEPSLVKTIRSVGGGENEPYATEHELGWALNGPVQIAPRDSKLCCRTLRFGDIEHGLELLYRQEFADPTPGVSGMSADDKLWYSKVKDSLIQRDDLRLQIELPFRRQHVNMPDNYAQARSSLVRLRERLLRDSKFRGDYVSFVEKLVNKGYMERVPGDEVCGTPGKYWFLIHHAVYHKTKAKIRVVFDCSRGCAGVSLNDELLPGPDLMNKLVGVLLRFRRERVAFAGDIEQMFMQLKVPASHSDFMRVLWWPGGDLNKPPEQYRLTSHTFGAVSSPSIANYAVKWVARSCGEKISNKAVETLEKCAYVDDLMNSFATVEQARTVLGEVRKSLGGVGFNLRSIISNYTEVLSALPEEARSSECIELSLDCEDSPHDRVLGVLWNIERDAFCFRPNVVEGTLTRRGMLSIISRIYDPLGFISPVIVTARTLFQETCRLRLGWDEVLPSSLIGRWKHWISGLSRLFQFSLPRCLKGEVGLYNRKELHVFSDGSNTAYAAAVYVRVISATGEVHCVLVMSKARQVPVMGGALSTIPRIELNAAKLAVSLSLQVMEELGEDFDGQYFWSDSQTVLRYIRSTSARFQRFVENRVNFIVEHTARESWRYVPGNLNIADVASRGLSVERFVEMTNWVRGPEFLWQLDFENFEEPENKMDLPEVRVAAARHEPNLTECPVRKLLASTGSWIKLLYRVAAFLSVISGLGKGNWTVVPFTNDDLRNSELAIWRFIQGECFSGQLQSLRRGHQLRREDKLFKLSPVLGNDGIIRVGGRLEFSSENYGTRHPVILPGGHPVVAAMIRSKHLAAGHFGVSYVESCIREDYHVLRLRPTIKGIVRDCVLCRKISGRPMNPVMANLPPAQAQKAFFKIGVDFFGPFSVGQGRGTKKVWGIVFSCLASRAIHLDVADSLETGSFLNSFRRFVARRGKCSEVYSDNGTNLVGAWREIRSALGNWDRDRVLGEAASQGITWHFNPPKASHYGGIWEREIRSVRKVFWGLMQERNRVLNREELYTLFCEIESILNSRPLTPVVAESIEAGPLTPKFV